MRDNAGGETFYQSSDVPTEEAEAAYGRAMKGFLTSLAASVAGVLILPNASFLAIVLAIVALWLFGYALKHSATGSPSPRSA